MIHKLFSLLNSKYRQSNTLNCTLCPIKDFCSGRICPSTSYDMTGNPGITNSITCYWHIILYGVAKNICDTAALENNQIFKEFLSNIGISYQYL